VGGAGEGEEETSGSDYSDDSDLDVLNIALQLYDNYFTLLLLTPIIFHFAHGSTRTPTHPLGLWVKPEADLLVSSSISKFTGHPLSL
jgi:hypothetical protein